MALGPLAGGWVYEAFGSYTCLFTLRAFRPIGLTLVFTDDRGGHGAPFQRSVHAHGRW